MARKRVDAEVTRRVRAVLASLSILSAASDEELDALAAHADDRTWGPDEAVVVEGRIPTHLYAVVSGELDVFTSGEDREEPRKINELGPGDHFGEIGLIEGMPSTATVKTRTSCELVRVPAADFLRVVSDSPQLLQPLLERVAGGLARSHPSYRLAIEGTGSADAVLEDVRTRAAALTEIERDRLVRGLRAWLEEQASR